MGELQAAVLLVDDRPANLLALEAILQPLGLRLVRANSGEEALKQVLNQDFAVILMDVQMPGLDGFQTAKLIKDRPRSRHIPVIFLTAISKDPAYIFKGYEQGAVDYLLKPFDPQVLRAKVSVFVELWRRGEVIKENEAQLRRVEQERLQRIQDARYRSMIDSLPQCVFATRPDGSIYMWNRSWLAYSGLDDAAMERGEFRERLHPDDRERVEREWQVSTESGLPLETEYRLRRANGEYRWHLAKAMPEHDERGRIVGWICTATDVDELRSAREQAQEASRTKDEFLATVSHELRNPLNAILGWMRMLRSGRLDDGKVERALETIERNTEAQLALIEDILDVSRIITGKMRIVLRPVSLSQVISAAVDTVRPAAEQKDIRIETALDGAADSCSGDPDRLQQVVWNLLSNAIKFTPRGGRVEVRLERSDSHVVVRVTDNGRGIASEFLPYVFERFRQAESISTRTQGGLGLGLAIVRHVVESHGGTVSVDSPGETCGTTFMVRLPLRAVQALPEPLDSEITTRRVVPKFTEAPQLDGLRVLVVDDEPDARELLALVLTEVGAQVIAVGSAEEAFAVARTEPIDVLVSDVGLPREDGYSLIQRIRGLEGAIAQVPAAALTGFARAEDGHKALACGFQLHVPKPVEPGLLVSLVAKLAGRVDHSPRAAVG
jgi:PAS domain S-box-containing protein